MAGRACRDIRYPFKAFIIFSFCRSDSPVSIMLSAMLLSARKSSRDRRPYIRLWENTCVFCLFKIKIYAVADVLGHIVVL